MKTKDTLELSQRQLEKMGDKELRRVVSTMRSTSRKRYERIVESEVYSQAAVALLKSSKGDTVLPSVAGMDRISLLNEYKRYKQFLTSKTSTVTGARKVENKTKSMINDLSGGKNFTDEEVTELFIIADELKNEMNFLQSSTDRISAVAEVYDPSKTKDEIMQQAKNVMVSNYERENPTNNEPIAIHPSRGFN